MTARPGHFFQRGYLLLVLAAVVVFLNLKPWQDEKPIIDWDVTLYYSYLPGLIIYQDLAFDNPAPVWGERHFYMNRDTAGHRFVKMTAGLAYLYAPFFLGSHAFATLHPDYPADGFSPPYEIGLLISSLCFALLGLWLLGKTLLQWYRPGVVLLVLTALYFGTNLLYYSQVSPMSHAYSFALVCLLLYGTFAYFRKQNAWRALLIGLAAGLLILIRPTNIIALLFPLVLLPGAWKQLHRGQFVRHLIWAVLIALVIWLPQMAYWHKLTGHWFFYSYSGEHFYFLDPKIWQGLLSYRKGWFLYSPVLLLALPGLVMLFRQDKRLASGGLAVILIALWVSFSWWCWWYGGSFGARPLIEYLPFMALGLAAFGRWISRGALWRKIPLLLVAAFLTFLGFFMNWQYRHGLIHHDSMSRTLYWKQFLRPDRAPDYWNYLDTPDYEAARRGDR